MQSHIRKVYACLAVTCHLHLGRMTGIFYVLLQKYGGGMDTKIRVSTEVDPGAENSPAAPAGIRTHNLLITGQAL